MPRSQSFQELSAKLSSDELVKRLKASRKLLSCDNVSEENSRPLGRLATSLVQPFLVSHRNREIRTLTASCIAEVFRVFFPDPPYDDDEIKVAFSLFVSQLQGLEKPSSATFRLTFSLLECLSSLRIFNLCLSMGTPDLLADLFKMVFSIINNQQSSKVKQYLIDMLASLLQEGETPDTEIIDIILMNLIEPAKSDNKPAYAFTVELVKKASNHLEPTIQLIFNNALVVGATSESEVGDHLYELILELHSIDSSLLLSVMPQLEFKLKSTDVEERLEVTRLLARMFSPRGATLAHTNKPLWHCFLSRYHDVAAAVRIECVRYSKYFLVYHPDLVGDVTEYLHDRIHDTDERVRLEAVKAVCEAMSDDHTSVPEKLLEALQGRMRDKVWGIRKETTNNVARLYRQLMSGSFSSGGAGPASTSPAHHPDLDWMPNKILHCYYLPSNEHRLCVERCLLSCVVPVSLQSEERMDRLSQVYHLLDSNATRAFNSILTHRHRWRVLLSELVAILQDQSLASDEKREEAALSRIIPLANGLPDPVKSQAHLLELSRLLKGEGEREGQLRESLLSSIDISSSCQNITRAKAAVVSELSGKGAGLVDTVRALLDESCPILVDAHCVGLLVEKAAKELNDPTLGASVAQEEELNARAKKTILLCKVLAECLPAHFNSGGVFERLLGLVRHEDHTVASAVLEIFTLTAKFIDKKTAGCLQGVLLQQAQKGPPQLAKRTVRCIQAIFSDEANPTSQRLLKHLMETMQYSHEHLLTTLESLTQIARFQPELFEPHHKLIVRNFLVMEILTIDRSIAGYDAEDAAWPAEGEEFSKDARAKALGMKLLTGWLRGMKGEAKAVMDFAQPVLKMVTAFITRDGDLNSEGNISAPDRSWLRLAAAKALLRLVRRSECYEVLKPQQIEALAHVTQDKCEQVRDRFMGKLAKWLRTVYMPVSFLSFFALAGSEPRKETKSWYRTLLVEVIEKRREWLKTSSLTRKWASQVLPEYSLPYAVYILAHHPQFSRTEPKSLDLFRDCLWFLLEPILHKGGGFEFLRRTLEEIKQRVDGEEPTNAETNKNIYAVCDLAFGVLQAKSANIKIGDFPGEVEVHVRLFAKKKGSKTNAMRYLPPDYDCTPSKSAEQQGIRTASAIARKKGKPPPQQQRKAKRPPMKGVMTSTPIPRTPPRKSSHGSTGDSGLSDIEEQEEPESTVDTPIPTPSKRRSQASKPSAVRRKILRKDLSPDRGSEEAEASAGRPKKKGKQATSRAKAKKVRKSSTSDEEGGSVSDEEDTTITATPKSQARGKQRNEESMPVEGGAAGVRKTRATRQSALQLSRSARKRKSEEKEESEVETEEMEEETDETLVEETETPRKTRSTRQTTLRLSRAAKKKKNEDRESEVETEDETSSASKPATAAATAAAGGRITRKGRSKATEPTKKMEARDNESDVENESQQETEDEDSPSTASNRRRGAKEARVDSETNHKPQEEAATPAASSEPQATTKRSNVRRVTKKVIEQVEEEEEEEGGSPAILEEAPSPKRKKDNPVNATSAGVKRRVRRKR